jgi:acylphosphatase
MSEQVRRRVVVHGQVQGVFFRDTCRRKASERGVAGWVTNRRDGAVEAVFCGRDDGVEAMLDACREGPRTGRIDDVAVSPGDEALIAEAGSGRFEVLPTA